MAAGEREGRANGLAGGFVEAVSTGLRSHGSDACSTGEDTLPHPYVTSCINTVKTSTRGEMQPRRIYGERLISASGRCSLCTDRVCAPRNKP